MTTINIQPIEKRIVSDGESLDVHSIFLTIQGEGPFTGRRAIFVRLAGCNLQCPGCDTDYTNDRVKMSVADILRTVREERNSLKGMVGLNPLVVITGGEPLRQTLEPLLLDLAINGFSVQVETNGTLGIESKNLLAWAGVTIVCSPKAGKVHPSIHTLANCFKYVLQHNSVSPVDGLPILALSHSAAPQVARPLAARVPIYLQPMDEKDDVANTMNQKAVLESCLKYGYVLQLQVHKLLNVE